MRSLSCRFLHACTEALLHNISSLPAFILTEVAVSLMRGPYRSLQPIEATDMKYKPFMRCSVIRSGMEKMIAQCRVYYCVVSCVNPI